MSMRYIVRRNNAADLGEVKRDVPDLDSKLGSVGTDYGTAGAHYRKDVEVNITPMRYITYQFIPKKEGTAFTWTCPSIELVAESEEGIFALCDRVKAERPAHLIIK